MCLVHLEGVPKLQAGCSTQVMKDGMVVRTDTPEVAEAQQAMMEFLLINHPLDCPICDQAGECGLQDYAFKHGVAFSRFQYEDKRTYPGKERIPLGPHVLLNMNRCIQCTRCIRFTKEISETGELGFFERGARTEIGVFPGKPLDNELSTCVVDICPVGALTSSRFRFAERVWNLDKKPSICAGCDAGCNITIEHRRGAVKRLKPRYNPDVNDYWMCDYGRASHERFSLLPRLTQPALRDAEGGRVPATWKEAVDAVARQLRANALDGACAIVGSGNLSNEEAYLLAKVADAIGSPHRSVYSESGPLRRIPSAKGGVEGRETSPNRRGAELVGLVPAATAQPTSAITAEQLLSGDAAASCSILVIADSAFGPAAHDAEAVARLRQAAFLVVLGWADTPLARAADVVLPVATHAEQDGSFINSQWRVQAFEAAFPAPGQARSGVEALADLLSRIDAAWVRQSAPTAAEIFDRIASDVPAFEGLASATLPASGATLARTPMAVTA
jgi:NADH-quinone oxidoreductase subunit G